jgi:hypothetical protein
VKLDRAGIRGLGAKLRVDARHKTNNPFVINQVAQKNRAGMRVLSNGKLASFVTGSSNSQRLSAKSGSFPCFQLIRLCLVLRRFSRRICESRRFQSQFNLLSRLPLAIGGNLGLE